MPQTLVFLHAHPDDEALLTAGTMARASSEGQRVVLITATSGEAGLAAHELQDRGFDTLDANEQLGFDADERVYLPAAQMLRQLGIGRVRLLTNNPGKVDGLARCGITVEERVPHTFPSNQHNELYIRTKAGRGGHLL